GEQLERDRPGRRPARAGGDRRRVLREELLRRRDARRSLVDGALLAGVVARGRDREVLAVAAVAGGPVVVADRRRCEVAGVVVAVAAHGRGGEAGRNLAGRRAVVVVAVVRDGDRPGCVRRGRAQGGGVADRPGVRRGERLARGDGRLILGDRALLAGG